MHMQDTNTHLRVSHTIYLTYMKSLIPMQILSHRDSFDLTQRHNIQTNRIWWRWWRMENGPHLRRAGPLGSGETKVRAAAAATEWRGREWGWSLRRGA